MEWEKHLQITYLIWSQYPKYMKSSHNSIAKKTWLKMVRRREQTFCQRDGQETHKKKRCSTLVIISSVQLLSRVRLLVTHELQHTRPPCPSPTSGVHPNSWVSDTIQPSHPLLSPSLPALNLSQHQGLFKWVSSSHQVAKVLELQLQHQSFQWTPRTDLL